MRVKKVLYRPQRPVSYTSRVNHHAYLVTGDLEKGIAAALAFGERSLGLTATGNPDVIVLRYGLLSVDDARDLSGLVSRTALGEKKLVVAAAGRIFHEAQNALLKTFEEPSEGTTIILIVPSEGIIIPTLRSRLITLPTQGNDVSVIAQEFLAAKGEGRGKVITRILDRAKKDAPEEKQAARADALALTEGLLRAGYVARTKGDDSEALSAFLSDLTRFVPILHERSAPLKPILEHIVLTAPSKI